MIFTAHRNAIELRGRSYYPRLGTFTLDVIKTPLIRNPWDLQYPVIVKSPMRDVPPIPRMGSGALTITGYKLRLTAPSLQSSKLVSPNVHSE